MTRIAACSFVALVLGGCASFPRAMSYDRVPSAAMRDVWMEFAVLEPTDRGESERLPLVVFLHGGGDGPDSFDRHGVSTAILEGWASGSLPRAVIVLPEGDLGFWANWYDGTRSYEDFVVDEVVPRVRRRYATEACPEGCHLMGVSMGAEGTMRIGVHRRGTFRTLTAISGPAYDTEHRIAFANDPLINIAIPTWHIFGPPTPRARVEADDPWLVWQSNADVGASLLLAWGRNDRDFVRDGSSRLDHVLTERGVEHVAWEFEGGHDWTSWTPVIVAALRQQVGASTAARKLDPG